MINRQDLLDKWDSRQKSLEDEYDKLNTSDLMWDYERQCQIDEQIDIVIEFIKDLHELK